jgi:hypothetical protein
LSVLDHPVDIIVTEASLDHKAPRCLPGLGEPVVGLDHDRDHAFLRHAKALEHVGDLPRRGFKTSISLSAIIAFGLESKLALAQRQIRPVRAKHAKAAQEAALRPTTKAGGGI